MQWGLCGDALAYNSKQKKTRKKLNETTNGERLTDTGSVCIFTELSFVESLTLFDLGVIIRL